MNSFSKAVCAFLICLCHVPAFAVNIQAIYTAACKREIGLVLGVSSSSVRLLDIDGRLREIPRYEIIFVADYPFDRVPMASTVLLQGIDQIRVKTLKNGEVADLVKGWPIGFSKEKISFLSETGDESIIGRDSIFAIDRSAVTEALRLAGTQEPSQFSFVHPFAFRECPLEKGRQMVYPQQILSDPVVIKRELDRLLEGYQLLERYEREQAFYAVPKVYENRTLLGLWTNTGSRYGAAGRRINNATPVLTDERSSDVFSYQHRIVTGSAPNSIFMHEEAQAQLYYAFKASYFRFDFFADPSSVLIGNNYRWRESDFSKTDFRFKESLLLGLAFEFGSWKFALIPVDEVNWAFYDGQGLYEDNLHARGVGFGYRNHRWGLEATLKEGRQDFSDYVANVDTQADIGMNAMRVNFTYYAGRANWMYSWMYRVFTLDGRLADAKVKSSTHALEWNYHYSHKYSFGAYAGLENLDVDHIQAQADNYFKFGVFAGLSF